MKINVDSWHYTWMAYFKYGRLKEDFEMDYSFRDWRVNNIIPYADARSFATFKRYMVDTGKYAPVDFCSYWRNVLLWPMIPVTFWLITIVLFIAMLATINFTGAAIGIGFILTILALIIGFIALMEGMKYFSKKVVVESGFMANVRQSLHTHGLCSFVEYEKKDAA